MKYYPVFWDIRGKKCVIVGGGEVAARKAERLLDCGAKVFVISPELSPELAALKEKKLICHIAAVYTGDLIDGAALIIGATDDEKINARISSDARSRNIPVNIVDDPRSAILFCLRLCKEVIWRLLSAPAEIVRRWPAICVKSWNQNTAKNMEYFSTSWEICASKW